MKYKLAFHLFSVACNWLYLWILVAASNWLGAFLALSCFIVSLVQAWWAISGKKQQMRNKGLHAMQMLESPHPYIEDVFTVQLAISSGCLSATEMARAVSSIAIASAAMNADSQVYGTGDYDCRYNARNPYLLCAVNPTGTCTDCPHFEPINYVHQQK